MSFKRMFRGSPASYNSVNFITQPWYVHSGVGFLKGMALVHFIKWITLYKLNVTLNTDIKLNLARDMCVHNFTHCL